MPKGQEMTQKELLALVHDLQLEVTFLRECVTRLSNYTKNTGTLGPDGTFTIKVEPCDRRVNL